MTSEDPNLTFLYREARKQDEAKRTTFIDSLRSKGSVAALSAVDSLDAALWLLSLDKTAQALLLFCQTLEVALKGFLEEIHVLLTQDKLDWDLAKGLVQDTIKRHRIGNKLKDFSDPADYDPRHTCGLIDAFKRVEEMIPFTSISSRRSVEKTNTLRNQIVHYGGDTGNIFEYLDTILNILLPLLEEFYEKTYELRLADLVVLAVYREIGVARSYLNLAKQNSSVPRTGILTTYSCKLHSERFARKPPDDTADQWRYGWLDFEHEFFDDHYEKMEKKWGRLLPIRVGRCIICDSPAAIIAVTDTQTQDGQRVAFAEAIECIDCGLYIDKSHKELARLHYGAITEDRYPGAFKEKH